MSTQTNTAEKSTQKIGARTLALVGMLSAVAVVLMTFDIPLPFAPTFYKIDFSEVPVLIGCFTMGPLAGVGIELIKNLLHIVISGTQTAGVGEVANFLIGCAFIVPAGLIYHKKHTRTGALIGMASGTVLMTVIGGLIGIMLGILGGYAICSIISSSMGTQITPGISLSTILAATLFSCAVGVFFGIYPARKAAKLSPIEALRRN